MMIRLKHFKLLSLVVVLGVRPVLAQSVVTESAATAPQQHLTLGRDAFTKGNLDEAVRHWQHAARLFAAAQNPHRQVGALVNLAAAYQAMGQANLAVETLKAAVAVAEAAHDRAGLLLAKSTLSATTTCGSELAADEQNLRESLALAEAEQNPAITAVIWNNLGNWLAGQNQTTNALDAFQHSVSLAQQTTNHLLAAKALANAAATAARARQDDAGEQLNAAALHEIATLPRSHEQAFLYLRLGQTDALLQQWPRAAAAYRQGLATAEALGDQRALTYALGYLGQVAEQQQEFAQALALTRQAAFVAQQIQSPDALYRWEWQIARLLKAQGDRPGAIRAYRRALQTLQPIRSDLALGQSGGRATFREAVGPVYFELADLLLLETSPDKEQNLRAAQATIEQFKSVELEDYFRDECLALLQAKTTRLENVSRKTAVIYIIPLPDRTELLVGLAGGLQQFTVPVSAEQLTAVVRQCRLYLEKRTTNQYRVQTQQLYQWLIAPLKPTLTAQRIDTLVFVPDGALRTIPFAALQEGDQFLIEQYAVAISPGLTLLAPHPMSRQNLRVLAAGLSERVQNYPALPYVTTELANLQALFQTAPLLNEKFLLAALQRDFAENQYQVVHLATHGQFNKNFSQSFLLTHDGKLTLDQLEALLRPSQARGKPVELLTLSACQTAAGDDRAALGLAGVAIKAGARSALATLWFVQDESTATVVTGFYDALRRDPALSKAKALQLAQVKLLKDPRYEHPGYWAPYLLIGNWL